MAWRIISLGCIPLCLLIYVNNVSLCFRRSRVPSRYPVSTIASSSSLRNTVQEMSANHVLHEPFSYTSSTEHLTCADIINPGYSQHSS